MQCAGGFFSTRVGGLAGTVILHGALLLLALTAFRRPQPDAAPPLVSQAAFLVASEREADRPRIESVAIPPPTIQQLPAAIPPPNLPSLPGELEVTPVAATAVPDNAIHVPEQAPSSSNPSEIPDDYVARIALRVAAVKRYPVGARKMGLQGTVILSFSLDRSGRLLSSRIVRSSKVPELDEEAARMLSAAAPFPAFPATMTEPEQVFEIPVEFSLHGMNPR